MNCRILFCLGLLFAVIAPNAHATTAQLGVTPGSGQNFICTVDGSGNYLCHSILCDPTTSAQCLGINSSGQITISNTSFASNVTQLNGTALGSPSNYGTSPGAVSVQGVNAYVTNSVPVTGTFWQPTQPVSGLIYSAATTPTISTSLYSSGYVWGGIITLSNVLSPTTFLGELTSLTLKFKGSIQTLQFDVALFTASPSNGTYADHATPTWNTADMANLVGIYSLTAANNDFGTMSVYNLDGINKAIVGASTSLYAVIIGKGTSTNNPASTSDMTIAVGTIL